MPDIHCRHCGEPWDIYELHEVYVGGSRGSKKVPYKQAAQLFRELGCGAFQTGQRCTNDVVDPAVAEHSGVLQDMLEYPDEWILD